MVIKKIKFCLYTGVTLTDKLMLIIQTAKLFFLSHLGRLAFNAIKNSSAKKYTLKFSGVRHELNLRLQDLGVWYDIFMIESYRGVASKIDQCDKPINEIIIWDIGAHIGLVSVYYQSIFKQYNLKIVTVEPSKENFAILIKNLPKTNRTYHENCAVGNESQLGFLKEDGLAFNNSLSAKGNENEAIQISSFNDLLKKYPCSKIDIMKIDIEGGEYAFLSDINQWPLKPQSIIIELHDEEKNKELIAKIEALGIKLIIV